MKKKFFQPEFIGDFDTPDAPPIPEGPCTLTPTCQEVFGKLGDQANYCSAWRHKGADPRAQPPGKPPPPPRRSPRRK